MLKDLNFYSEKFLKILTKRSTLDPLVFNPYQSEVTKLIEEDVRNKKPTRVIVLKARQLGISTWATSYVFHQAVTNKYKKGVIIANDQDSTNNLFNMAKRYYDFLPERLKPMKRYSNQKALVFENPNEELREKNPGLISSIMVENANKLTAGRSGTINLLHCSEVAFWKNASTVVSGLFQAVPYEPGTAIVLESTANGIVGDGQEFYERWDAAERGESEFTPVFFKWTLNPEYEIEPPIDFELNKLEKELVKQHPELTPRKLMFRRYKIRNEMGSAVLDSSDQFKQEFPLTPFEAFIASGRPVFKMEVINQRIARIDKKGKKQDNGLVVYEEPAEGKYYAVGADVAEGLLDGDMSTIFVIDNDLNQVASFEGHIEPGDFGKLLCQVGEKYNKALVAVEVNNHGHTVVSKMRDLRYFNVYTREVKEQLSEEYTKKIGWHTNTKTKMKMLDDFVEVFRDDIITLYDKALLREMSTLSVEADGNVILNSKDRTVATCIAIQAIKQANYGDFKAVNPNKFDKAPKTLEDKLKLLSKRRTRGESQFS